MIKIVGDIDLNLEMPDGSSQAFTLANPNGRRPFGYRINQYSPSGKAIFKDPLRRRQQAGTYYYPEFHFGYQSQKLFLIELLAAANIVLFTPFGDQQVNCLLQNGEAVEEYLQGLVTSKTPGGAVELIFAGRRRETWQQILRFYFYFTPEISIIYWDSTQYTFDNSVVNF